MRCRLMQLTAPWYKFAEAAKVNSLGKNKRSPECW
jgi:hypothetical protein